MMLEVEGYHIIVAHDGEEALQKAYAEKPDLILLDIVMPKKNGLEVCKTLKTKSETRSIPVVMFTVLGKESAKKAAENAGAAGFIVKPFKLKSLISEVKKHIQK